MKNKLIASFLLLFLTISINVSAASFTNFSDVQSGDWYYSAVDYATTNGLFNRTSDTAFSPNVSMTRGMFVAVLGRLANVSNTYGTRQSTPFVDVTQADYFFPYAVWANDNGIVSGVGNNTFDPNGEITREQMATILFRYAEEFGYDITYSADKYNAFSDTISVSTYAINAMQWATTHNIINGDNNKLSPQDYASRAQVAQIFLNFSNLEVSSPTNPPIPTNTPASTATPSWEDYNPTYTLLTGKSAIDADGGYYDYDLANEVFAQVNASRVENGVKPLLYNPKIQEWASVRAKEQVTLQGHTRPNGGLYSSVGVGLTFENITILNNCTTDELNDIQSLAARAVNNWFTSTEGHKEAMLSASSNLGGIACYVKGNTVYIVNLFSDRTLYFMDYLI